MTLQIVKLAGIEPAPHYIVVDVVPLTKATDPAAQWPSTVPIVTVPADLAPVLPAHVCPAHLLSNFCVNAFQSEAREVMKGTLRASTGPINNGAGNLPYGAHLVLFSLNVQGGQYLHTSNKLSRIWSGQQTQLSRDGDPAGDVMPIGHAQHACDA